MIQIPIARRLPSGEFVTPEQVPSGLQLDVTCLECGEPLICRKGTVRVAHFAHQSQSESICTGETWLHSFAKQIIEESEGKSLRLPDMGAGGVSCKIDEVRLEHHLNELSKRVDAYVRLSIHYKSGGPAVVVASNQWLAIEITVTNPKDDEYVSQFVDTDIPVLEVVLDRHMHAFQLYSIHKPTTLTSCRPCRPCRGRRRASASLPREYP